MLQFQETVFCLILVCAKDGPIETQSMMCKCRQI